MSIAAPPPGPSLVINICRHCGDLIERWSGPARTYPWRHGAADQGPTECDPGRHAQYKATQPR